VAAAVVELKAGACDEVPDCTGNEDFTGAGKVRNPCGGMHGYATNVIIPDLDLAGMEAAAHFDSKGSEFLDDCGGAAHAAGRAVKGGKEAVAKRLDLASAVTRQFLTHRLVVPCQQNAPIAVPKLGRPPG
jgi:hypothetical protein